MKICKLEKCNNKYLAQGYCNKHYKRFKLYGDPLILINDGTKGCKIEECDNKHHSKGFCRSHYSNFKNNGDPLYVKSIIPIKICLIKGCKEKHCAKGFCQKHYDILKRHGDPLFEIRIVDPMRGCNIYGCDEKHSGKGFCQKHYNQEYPEIGLRGMKKYLTKYGKTFDMHSDEYGRARGKWSKTIRKLDNNMCKLCDSTENLHAHHLFPVAQFPDLSLNLDNGITLCESCHDETHGFKTYTNN